MKERTLIAAVALNMFVAVGCGAFGAHGLKKMISEEMLAIWHTAVTYQVMHALGMIAIALLMPRMAGAAVPYPKFLPVETGQTGIRCRLQIARMAWISGTDAGAIAAEGAWSASSPGIMILV